MFDRGRDEKPVPKASRNLQQAARLETKSCQRAPRPHGGARPRSWTFTTARGRGTGPGASGSTPNRSTEPSRTEPRSSGGRGRRLRRRCAPARAGEGSMSSPLEPESVSAQGSRPGGVVDGTSGIDSVEKADAVHESIPPMTSACSRPKTVVSGDAAIGSAVTEVAPEGRRTPPAERGAEAISASTANPPASTQAPNALSSQRQRVARAGRPRSMGVSSRLSQ